VAETSFIIENGRRLNLSDTTARKSIGSCSELKTDTKHCLVDAINELTERIGGGTFDKDVVVKDANVIVSSGDVLVENGGIAVGDLFFNSASMNSGGIVIETDEGKITLSIRGGLCFEDVEGNINRLGGIEYIAEANPNNAVMYGDMEQYVEEIVEGVKIETDNHTIIYGEDGKLSVNTADEVGDNTLPITAAAVNTTVGNIEVLLKTI